MLGAARYATPEWIAEESATAREIGGGLLGIGLMTWSLDADDSLLDAALAERPRVVSLSFGDPAPYVERVHAAGALAVSQVNTLDDLHVVERAGVDFVIAQGGEAGGHTGRIGTLPLLQEVLDATNLPVLAAGGIGTGRGLAAVIAAGAEGAMIGTALLASPETIGPEYARRKLIEAAVPTPSTRRSSIRRAISPGRRGGAAVPSPTTTPPSGTVAAPTTKRSLPLTTLQTRPRVWSTPARQRVWSRRSKPPATWSAPSPPTPNACYAAPTERTPSLGAVADRLDVVAVGIAHERAVVAGVVLRPFARCVQNLCTRLDRGRVEGIDRGSGVRDERHMVLAEAGIGRDQRADPEVRVWRHAVNR